MLAEQLRSGFPGKVQAEWPEWPLVIMSSKLKAVNAFVKLGWPLGNLNIPTKTGSLRARKQHFVD